MPIQNPVHHRQSPREGVVQFDHVGHADVGKGGLHLFPGDAVMPDEKVDVFHVPLVVAAHHLGEDEIDRMGTEELQVASSRTKDRDDVLGPVGAEEDLILVKHVRHVEPLFLELLVDLNLSLLKRIVRIQRRPLLVTEDHIDIQ